MSDHNRANNQEKLIKAAISNSITNTVAQTGNIPSLFLLTLGGNAVHVGILATAIQSFQAAKIIGLKILPLVGKARLCSWGRLLAIFPMLALAFIAVLPGNHYLMIVLAIFMFALRGVLVACGNTSWQPLIQDSIRRGEIGTFFARMRIRMRMVDVAFPILLGLFLGASPSSLRFAPLFLLGAAFALASCFYFSGVVEKPMPPGQKPLVASIKDVFRKKAIRRYGFFNLVTMLLLTASVPFWVVILKDYAMPASHLVWLGTAAAAGNIIGIGRWGQASDRFGSRLVISLTLLPMAALGIFWIFMPYLPNALLAWALILHLFQGFLSGGMGIARTRAMVQAVPESCQAEGFVVIGYMQAMGGAAGGILGGLAFRWISGRPQIPGGLDPRQAYLAMVQLMLVIAWLFSRRLKDKVEGGKDPAKPPVRPDNAGIIPV